MQGTQIWSLVGERGSHRLQGNLVHRLQLDKHHNEDPAQPKKKSKWSLPNWPRKTAISCPWHSTAPVTQASSSTSSYHLLIHPTHRCSQGPNREPNWRNPLQSWHASRKRQVVRWSSVLGKKYRQKRKSRECLVWFFQKGKIFFFL